MASRRATATKQNGLVVITPPAAPAPLARRRSSGGGRRRRSSGKRRRAAGHARGGGIDKRIQHTALGGLAYGLLVKNWPNMPRLPGIGRSGTVALAVYFLKPASQLLQDLGVAAAAIAGYTFGETGTVSGDDDGVLSSD